MGYALIPPKFINANNPENYHLFNASINNGIINISKQSKCEETANKINFNNLHEYTISISNGSKITSYNYLYDRENCIFYFDNKNIARLVIAFFRGDKACGTCISTL
ncbi:hypothetical protein Q5M87_13275, partial [Brachyspira innocens]|uniref:hypothetical protein n=1 Tax=Brachyspira innocens TaxID=13264 RepID=UPI0026F1B3F6